MLNLANKLSIFRILLIPVFVGCIMYYTPEKDFLRWAAIGIFILAVLSDALDGFIARVKGERTSVGAFFDPLADKLLLITVYISLSTVKSLPAEFKLPPWVVIIVISRDAVIVLGSAIIYIAQGKLHISPTMLGKITTVLQMLTVLALLLRLNLFTPIMYAMVFFTVLSGLDYIRIGNRLFNTINSVK